MVPTSLNWNWLTSKSMETVMSARTNVNRHFSFSFAKCRPPCHYETISSLIEVILSSRLKADVQPEIYRCGTRR